MVSDWCVALRWFAGSAVTCQSAAAFLASFPVAALSNEEAAEASGLNNVGPVQAEAAGATDPNIVAGEQDATGLLNIKTALPALNGIAGLCCIHGEGQ